MRLRLPELLAEKGVTPYRLAKDSGDRISLSAVYRLMKSDGKAQYLDTSALDAICDVLKVQPSELLTREDKPPKALRHARARRAKG